MASSASRAKRDREKAREERRALKLDRRQSLREEAAATAATPSSGLPHDEVLARLAALHERFANEEVDFEQFEEEKASLLAQLDI